MIITLSRVGMEEYEDTYDDARMEELAAKYPNLDEAPADRLDYELSFLEKDLRESESAEETMDIREEIAYAEELKRRRTQGEGSEEQVEEDLAEKYPGLADLPYDELMDHGDRLLNELVLGELDGETSR
jgi:hypothetical protein